MVQVVPLPVLANVALQIPVVTADAATAPLQADCLKCNIELTHARLQLAEQVCRLCISAASK